MELRPFTHWIAGHPEAGTRAGSFLQSLPKGGSLRFPRAGAAEWATVWQHLSGANVAGSRASTWGLLRHAAAALRADASLAEGVALSLGLELEEARNWLDRDLFQFEQALELLRDAGEGAARGPGVFVADWSDGIGALAARISRALLARDPIVLIADARMPWGVHALAQALFSAGLDDAALTVLWDDTHTLLRAATSDPRWAWLRVAGQAGRLAQLRGSVHPALELALWPIANRSLALANDFDPAQAARAAIEQSFGRTVTLSGQFPGHVARVICPERRFAAFTQAVLAQLEQADPRGTVPGIEADFSSDLEAAWRLALDEGACPIFGEVQGALPLVFTNVDPAMRLVRERRPRPLLCLIRAKDAAAAAQLALRFDAAPIQLWPSLAAEVRPMP